ncbi:MAG TPA: bifunctional diguanylate cyclase/phosphodiesterase [Mycobacteriales bacterium]|nr:bifunctional diguanylate cyclase/phosphodiesterase [Mycobacteriales bacterium]
MTAVVTARPEFALVHNRPRLVALIGVLAVGAAAVVVGPAAAGAVAVLVVVVTAQRRRGLSYVVAVVSGTVAVMARPMWLAQAGRVSSLTPVRVSSTAAAGAATAAVAGVLVAYLVSRWARQNAELMSQMVSTARARERIEAEGTHNRLRLESELQFWAAHDPLTALPNRTMLARELVDRIRRREPFGILVVSLTKFADVNATYGPTVGDQVLVAVSKRLRNALREHDLVARISGDEFAVLLHGLRGADAPAAGERIVATLRAPFGFDGVSLEVSGRAGLAIYDGVEEVLPTEMLRRAGVAATAGEPGAAPHVFAPELVAAAVERTRLVADLRRAISAGDELVCFYQPLVSTVDGRVASVEALARWIHPERGLISPAEFIPVAEASGLIVPLGLAMLSQACRQLRAWHAAGHGELTVAVNLSARQLVEPGVVESVADVVNRSGVNPSRIVLEITESLLVEDSSAAIETLWRLRGLGLRLAVDDFGTGYSSLSRLSEMPIDEMKIDKSFVDRIGAAVSDSVPIIRAAIAMGHALGLTVVAEGVESAEQLRELVAMDCDLLQGYLLARPHSAAETSSLLSVSHDVVRAESGVARNGLCGVPQQREEGWVPKVAPAPVAPAAERRLSI